MQIKKNEVKEKIRLSAYKEFMEKGFEKASVRNIAACAGVTKGSIYTYFASKDELFKSMVQPALNQILSDLSLEYSDQYKDVDFEENYNLEKSIEEFRGHVQILRKFKPEIYLLFFRSAGSELANYKEQIIIAYEASMRKFYETVGRYNSHLNTTVSELFIHSCAVLYLGFLEEILIHDPDDQTLNKFITELATFVHTGIRHVLKTPKTL